MMTALAFLLSELATGRVVGHAVVCPEARYAGVLRAGVDRIERRFTYPNQWGRIELEIAEHLEAGPLDRASPIVQVLVDARERSGVVVQYVATVPLDVAPVQVAAALDAQLRGFASTPRLVIRQTGADDTQ